MAKIEVDVDEATAKLIEKLTRKIDRLEKDLEKAQKLLVDRERTFRAMSKARDALLEVADHLDPYRYDDGP